jgi:PAS domain S-box-containing protein
MSVVSIVQRLGFGRLLRDARRAPDDALRALREAEERYRLAARATDDLIWDYDLRTQNVRWNEALTRCYGYAPRNMVTPIAWWEERLHPDDAPRVVASIEAAIAGSAEVWSEEYRFRRADGDYADVLDRGYVIRDDKRRSVRMVGAMLDQSERKRAEAALRASEERLRLAQEAGGLGTFEWKIGHAAADVSDTHRANLGLPPGEGLTFAQLNAVIHPDDRPMMEAHYAAVRAGTGASDVEFRIIRPSDGAVRWVWVSAKTYRDAGGRVIRQIGVSEDITERRLAADRLRDSEENYRFTVELSPQLPWTADADGSNLEIKRSLPDFPDVPPDASATDWTDLFTHPDDIALRRRRWAHSVRTGEPYDCEFRARLRDGSYRWVRSRAYPRRDEAGRIVRWYGVSEDVHAQHVAEQQLQRLQQELTQVARVSAMGTLASALAHELNQPLTAVANYMAGSKRLLANHGAAAIEVIGESLDNAAKAAVQAGEIVRRLRDLVSRGEANTQRVELAPLVDEACQFSFGDARDRSIELRLEFGSGAAAVLADRIQLQQVLVNLLRNAAEAMEKSATKTIRLSAQPSGEDQLVIRVEDSGSGVAPEVKRHLFSPFVTTKESGMGVGLSICRSIVEAHGGQLWVEDAPGGGAAFCFTLARAT